MGAAFSSDASKAERGQPFSMQGSQGKVMSQTGLLRVQHHLPTESGVMKVKVRFHLLPSPRKPLALVLGGRAPIQVPALLPSLRFGRSLIQEH